MLETFKNEPLTNFEKNENKKIMHQAIEKVERELGKNYQLIIEGKRIDSKDKFISINPSNKDEIVGVFPKAKNEHIEEAITAASKAFESWKEIPPEGRAAVLLRAAELLRKRKFEFAAWEIFEVGKNWSEADADVAEAIDYLEFYAREMLRYSFPQPITPLRGEYPEYIYIPLGVVVVIPPWNFPLAITLGMTTAAIVTGNTVILKPSSDAPTIAYKFVELLEEAGLPEGVLNLLTGPGSEVGDVLVAHPCTRMIAFTGSKEVGLHMNEVAAKIHPKQKWIKRVIAEMGGKDVIIIDKEYDDWEYAVNCVITSAYGFQGQKCSACSRLVVLEEIYDKFLENLVEKAKRIKIGPAKENYFMGPVINQAAENKILEYIEIGKKEGRLVIGGEKAEGNGFYVKPTIYDNLNPNARIAQEEIFGPILSVIKAKEFDEAIEIANNTLYGLTGSVFTKNRMKITKAKKLLYIGNLYINRKCTGAMVGVHPFGGFNMSGTDSKAGGRDYLLLFMQGKSISEKYDY